MKHVMIIIALLLLFALGVCGYIHYQDSAGPSAHTADPVATAGLPAEASAEADAVTDAGIDVEATASTKPTADPLLPLDLNTILDPTTTVPLDTIPESYTVLVSRDYLLPSDYIPAELVEPNVRFSYSEHLDKRKMHKTAAKALEKMFRAAEEKGIILYGVSGYRSYERQQSIYNRNVALHGKKATDALSAKPGSSEHQSGLAIDISASSVNCLLTDRLADTKEGKWIAKNCYKYGYVVRYPKGKTKITGYSYEPWHIRYVGVHTATFLYEHDLTLEEYYGVSNQSETKSGVDVEDTDNYATEVPSATSSATPSVSTEE